MYVQSNGWVLIGQAVSNYWNVRLGRAGRKWGSIWWSEVLHLISNAYGWFKDTDQRGNSLVNEDGTPKFKDFANMFVMFPCPVNLRNSTPNQDRKAGLCFPWRMERLDSRRTGELAFHRQEKKLHLQPSLMIAFLCGRDLSVSHGARLHPAPCPSVLFGILQLFVHGSCC